MHGIRKVLNFAVEKSRDRAVVAHWAHNPEVVGSNPAPATKKKHSALHCAFIFIIENNKVKTSAGCQAMTIPADVYVWSLFRSIVDCFVDLAEQLGAQVCFVERSVVARGIHAVVEEDKDQFFLGSYPEYSTGEA